MPDNALIWEIKLMVDVLAVYLLRKSILWIECIENKSAKALIMYEHQFGLHLNQCLSGKM